MLQLRNNRELLDDLLISMVTRCKHLERLQYDGILRSLDTLKDVLQLQSESKTREHTKQSKKLTIFYFIARDSTMKKISKFFDFLSPKFYDVNFSFFFFQVSERFT